MIALFAPLLLAGQFLIAHLFAGQWQTIRLASFLLAVALALSIYIFDNKLRNAPSAQARKLYLLMAGIAALIGFYFYWQYGQDLNRVAHLKNGGVVVGAPFAMWGLATAALLRAIVPSRTAEKTR